jgi:CBS domain containing-hemolysin-like protein
MIIVLAVLVLLLCSAMSSLVEAAIFSVPIARVEVALRDGRHGSRRLKRIKDDLHRPVAALVILNNIFNIGGSIFIGTLAQDYFQDSQLAVFTAVLTFLVILFAEIIPKTLGERFSGPIALGTAPALMFVTSLLSPVIWIVDMFIRPLSVKRTSRFPTEEEISALAHLGNQAGKIDQHEWELIHRVFRLNDVTARDIMTHRLKLTSLPAQRPLSELRPSELNLSHSRILVTDDGDIDKVVGIVHQRALLIALAEGTKGTKTVGDLKKSVLFVYESTPGHRLLQQFQETRQHLFVVVDEYGGTNGVVSLEDVLEELVGEILDETDTVGELSTNPVLPLGIERSALAENRTSPGTPKSDAEPRRSTPASSTSAISRRPGELAER